MQEPHQVPAITGETVVQKAPAGPPEFEWEDAPDADAPPTPAGEAEPVAAVGDVRRGSGEPELTPAQSTLPRSISPAALRTLRRLSGGTTVPVAAPKPDAPLPTQDARKQPVVAPPPAVTAADASADLTSRPAKTQPTAPSSKKPRAPAPSPEGPAGSTATQPADLSPGPEEAASFQGDSNPLSTDGWADLTEEVAEIQFLQLQGFDDEAREAVTPLAKKHPGHPDLAPICAALSIAFPSAPPSPQASVDAAPRSAPASEAASAEAASAASSSGTVPGLGAEEDDAGQDEDEGLAAADAEEHNDGTPVAEAAESPTRGPGAKADDADGDEFIEINVDITAPRMKAPPELVAPSPADGEPEPADRTVITAGLHSPRPFSGSETSPTLQRAPGPNTQGSVEDAVEEAEESPTFVTGTEPPPGGFVERQPGTPRTLAPRLTPKLGLSVQPEVKVPPRSADSMITSPRMPALPEDVNEDVSEDVSEDDDDPVTVVAPAPAEPPVTRMSGDVSSKDRVRLVMLGARGQAVAERVIVAGEALVLSCDPTEPWGDDKHLQEEHARLHPTAGGGVTVEVWGTGRVFRQVDERLRVRDGDLIRVGQSLVRYTATPGGWGTLTSYPLSGEPSASIPVGGSGAIVGRDSGELAIPDDTYISGAHCQFSCRGDDIFIEDLGSANGTYVLVRGGESVPFGGMLLAGQTQFKVRRATTRR